MSRAKLTLTGTGGSMGIPMLGCSCSVCQSSDPRNQRLRTAALLEWEGRRAAIDVGPDFRQQMLRAGIDHLDGVILTHAHYDHIGGIDELRAYYFRHHESIPCLLSQETADDIQKRYDYLFRRRAPYETPHLALKVIGDEPMGSTQFLGRMVEYVTYYQAGMRVLGFRFGRLAYLTDLYAPTEEIVGALKGVETLVVSALRDTPSPVHLTFDEAIHFSERVGAKQTLFTHIAHESSHDQCLPAGISMAYDGLEIEFEW